MKKKILILFLSVLTMFVVCFGMGNTVAAMAQETPETEQSGELIPEEEAPVTGENTPSTVDEEEENDLVMAFMQYLKDEYGEDYETYYNAIIEKWGSVKNYLDSKIQDGTITDESAEWWNAVVKWLDEYFVVWAPILAGAAVIVALVFGKKIYAGIKNLFNRLFKGTNQTAVAQIAIIDAVLLMLGTGEKTKAARDELLKAKEELLKNE